MRNEQIRKSQRGLQLQKKVDELSLDGYVNARKRLVQNQQFRIEGKRPCNGKALSLSAAEFRRATIGPSRRKLDLIHDL